MVVSGNYQNKSEVLTFTSTLSIIILLPVCRIIFTCRNLIPRIAEVAKTLEKTVEPLSRTTMEAETTIKSDQKIQ